MRLSNKYYEKLDISYQAADIALKNYNSWLNYGSKDYTTYERQILKQLNINTYVKNTNGIVFLKKFFQSLSHRV